ncbi:MAG: HAD family hydrolase [Candidatus Niyogibacteria bacterium]|nr:MAG: HAD family hydrolase [Candidatus Niyogibacteria bacterium]
MRRRIFEEQGRDKKILMLDLNNTLLNDFKIWRLATDVLFRIFGKEPPTTEEFFKKYRGPVVDTYRAFGIKITSEEIHKIFDSVYEAHRNDFSLAPGAYDLLFTLPRKGFIIVLVTACGRETAMNLLEKFEIQNAFDHLEFGAGDKFAAIKRLMLRERAEAGNCFYVGDSPSDMMHAKRAGVRAVAFLNGNIPEDLVLAEMPDYNARDFKELLIMLEAWDVLENFRSPRF